MSDTDGLSMVEPFRTSQDNLRISLFASKHKISVNDVEKLLAKKDIEMSDKLENLKFAYALSEARIKQLETKNKKLEDRIVMLRSCMNSSYGKSNDPASSTAFDDQFLLSKQS